MTFLFKTQLSMKPQDRKKWWIDNYVSNIQVGACNLEDALDGYVSRLKEDNITVSKNALKNKAPMYKDFRDGSTRQVGYVITGKTSFDSGNGYYVDKYIDIWVEILTITPTNFDC